MAGPTTTTSSVRPKDRKAAIVDAAADLFASRGSAAVGVSGPAIYRHFRGKTAFDQVGARVAVRVEQAIAEAASPADALGRLVRSFTVIAMDSVDLLVVTSGEGSATPLEERPRLARRRKSARHGWAVPLRELRPDLTEPEVRLLVRAAAQASGDGSPPPSRQRAAGRGRTRARGW